MIISSTTLGDAANLGQVCDLVNEGMYTSYVHTITELSFCALEVDTSNAPTRSRSGSKNQGSSAKVIDARHLDFTVVALNTPPSMSKIENRCLRFSNGCGGLPSILGFQSTLHMNAGGRKNPRQLPLILDYCCCCCYAWWCCTNPTGTSIFN